ncbi:MAG TPA: hypothetical protein IAC03_07340 [Candidatus Coprenecus pullistercoris]|nr:hypothetical protein [Candidatus Coprenecus pullistercoris]
MKKFLLLSGALLALLSATSCTQWYGLNDYLRVKVDADGNHGIYRGEEEVVPMEYQSFQVVDEPRSNFFASREIVYTYVIGKKADGCDLWRIGRTSMSEVLLYSAPEIEPLDLRPDGFSGNARKLYVGTLADGKKEVYNRFARPHKSGPYDEVYPGVEEWIFRVGDKWGVKHISNKGTEAKYDQVYIFDCYERLYYLKRNNQYELYYYNYDELSYIGIVNQQEIDELMPLVSKQYSPYSFHIETQDIPKDMLRKIKIRTGNTWLL